MNLCEFDLSWSSSSGRHYCARRTVYAVGRALGDLGIDKLTVMEVVDSNRGAICPLVALRDLLQLRALGAVAGSDGESDSSIVRGIPYHSSNPWSLSSRPSTFLRCHLPNAPVEYP